MTCDHCVRHVTEAISKVTGALSVNVKLTEGIAVIESDASLDLQSVKDAVVAAGYSV
jgi:copper chaperone CopZ